MCVCGSTIGSGVSMFHESNVSTCGLELEIIIIIINIIVLPAT